jgi:hypothetical protein
MKKFFVILMLLITSFAFVRVFRVVRGKFPLSRPVAQHPASA